MNATSIAVIGMACRLPGGIDSPEMLWDALLRGDDLVTEVPTVENGGMSADGLNWRLKFKEGIKWHDGTPFTAEDVKFTIELINNPDFRAGRRAGHELVRDIQVVSPTELTWRLEKPYAPYPAILSWTFIVPKHILGKEADPNTSSFNTAPVGTGDHPEWHDLGVTAGRAHLAGHE